MAQENIIIDLTDENLIIKPDIYVESAALDVTGKLTLIRTDGGVVVVDLLPLLTDIYADIHVNGGEFNSDTGQLVLHYNGGKEDISIDLSNVDFKEYGGTNYDPLKVNYPVGHVVTIPDGTAWICMADPQTAQPGTDEAQWVSITGSAERGGIIYDATTTYVLGDMVSYDGKGYIATRESIAIAPTPGGNLDWIDMSLSEYYAGDHTPDIAQEYPDRTMETSGAYWLVTGLLTEYTMTTGSLAGKVIGNGDKLLWNGTSWLFFPAPEFLEYGGVAFNTNFLYRAGHMVGFGAENTPYICIQDMTIADGSQEPTNSTYWRSISSYEQGGVVWNTDTEYNAGDIVSEGTSAYIAISGNTGQLPSSSPALWINLIPEDSIERGGVSWISNTSYLVGDVVSEGTNIYMRINSGGGSPTPPSSDPVFWKLLETGEASLGLWQSGITYYEGDIVSWENEIYVAPIGGVVPGTQPPEAPWVDVTIEYGGLYWNTGKSYTLGDMVSVVVSGVLSVFISKIDANVGNDPLISSEWEHVVSASESNERGGTYWNGTINYIAGDVVTTGSSNVYDMYVAVRANTNVPPNATNIDDWVPFRYNERVGIEWVSFAEYNIGDIVSKNGAVYRAEENSSGVDPSTETAAWYNIEAGNIPIGGIIMYDGAYSSIPAIYALCDGNNGTPDLRGQFIYGAEDEGQVGAVGGSPDAVNVSHSHNVNHEHNSASVSSSGSHSHTANHNHEAATTSSTGSHKHTINHDHGSANTGYAGSHTHTESGESGRAAVRRYDGGSPYSAPNVNPKATSSAGNHRHSFNMPSYSGSSSSTGAHTHTLTVPTKNITTSTIGGHVHVVSVPMTSVTSGSSGVPGAGKNLPPYYKLAYIKRIA